MKSFADLYGEQMSLPTWKVVFYDADRVICWKATPNRADATECYEDALRHGFNVKLERI